MTNWMRAGVAIAVGLGMAACGTAGACITASTSATAGSVCIDYGNGYSSSAAMAYCIPPSTYGTDPCPTTSRVGQCTITVSSVGGATATSVKSYYAPTPVSDAMSDCATIGMSGGTVATFAAN